MRNISTGVRVVKIVCTTEYLHNNKYSLPVARTMAAHTTKRKRADTAGISQPAPLIDCASIIEKLPLDTVRRLLLTAVTKHSDIATEVVVARDRLNIIERTKVRDFDDYSKMAWRAINVTYKGLSGSRQYQFAGESCTTVVDCIESIQNKCPLDASLGTKENALITLRKIGKTVCLGDGVIGREVQKHFQYDTCLEDTMLRIAEGMMPEERDDFMDTEWSDKLGELIDLSKDHIIFEGLSRLISVMDGATSQDDSAAADDDSDDVSSDSSTEV